MTATAWVVLVVVLVALAWLGWSLSSRATRLDRLHHRVETSTAALDAVLVRRAPAADQLGASGVLDPASALLLTAAAAEALAAEDPTERERAESDLSRLLRVALDEEACAALRHDPTGEELLRDLAAACERVVLARRFVNDAVVQAQRLRAQRIVRWGHLAGRSRAPETVELDDAPPPALLAV